jgi:hypothetical protein
MELSPEATITNAESAVGHARAVRKHHARRTKPGTPQREADIKLALQSLADAMGPIRRRLGRLPYENTALNVEGLRAASRAIQTERRKLWKMRRKKKRR